MDRINLYLQFVSLPVLATLVVAAIVLVVLVPRHRLWQVAIIVAPAWMLAGRSTDFPLIAVYAKALAFIPVLLLLIGLVRYSSPKYLPPGPCYWAIATGLSWICCVAFCSDSAYAIAIRSQWILMALVAGMLSGLIVWRDRLEDFMLCLFYASLGALAIMALALVFDPGVMFLQGHRRFSPWNTNPNQISLSLILSFATSIYIIISKRGRLITTIAIASAVLSSLMIVLTLSRSAVIMAGIVSAIMFSAIIRQRPVLFTLILTLGLFVVIRYLDAGEITIGRLRSLETGRVSIAQAYYAEIIQRPFVGLLGRSGNNSWVAADVGTHAHNVIVTTAYVGGAWLTLLLLITWVSMAWSVGWLYINKFKYPNLTAEISFITALFSAFSAYSFNNFAIIWPTYFESMLLLIFGCFSVQAKRFLPPVHTTFS